MFVRKNRDSHVKIGNYNLDSKNAVLFDFTSIASILSMIEYRKGTLLYEYMVSKYSFIDSVCYDKLLELYENLQLSLNDEQSSVYYNIVDDLNKILYEGIEPNINQEKIMESFDILLKEYLEKTKNKTIIIFYNSEIYDINFLNYDNVYSFNIAKQKSIEKYNLESTDIEMKEFNYELIKNNLMKIYPINYKEEEINKYIKIYYSYLGSVENIYAYSLEEFLIFSILSDKNKQKVIPKNIQISDNIIAFLASV